MYQVLKIWSSNWNNGIFNPICPINKLHQYKVVVFKTLKTKKKYKTEKNKQWNSTKHKEETLLSSSFVVNNAYFEQLVLIKRQLN